MRKYIVLAQIQQKNKGKGHERQTSMKWMSKSTTLTKRHRKTPKTKHQIHQLIQTKINTTLGLTEWEFVEGGGGGELHKIKIKCLTTTHYSLHINTNILWIHTHSFTHIWLSFHFIQNAVWHFVISVCTSALESHEKKQQHIDRKQPVILNESAVSRQLL